MTRGQPAVSSILKNGAGDESRTRDLQLGNPSDYSSELESDFSKFLNRGHKRPLRDYVISRFVVRPMRTDLPEWTLIPFCVQLCGP